MLHLRLLRGANLFPAVLRLRHRSTALQLNEHRNPNPLVLPMPLKLDRPLVLTPQWLLSRNQWLPLIPIKGSVMSVVNSLVLALLKTLRSLLVTNPMVVNPFKVLIRMVRIWNVVVPSLMLITPWMGWQQLGNC